MRPETVAAALEQIRHFHRTHHLHELSTLQRADFLALGEVIKNHHHIRSTTPLDKAIQASGLDNAVALYYDKWIARWNNTEGEL